MTEFFKLDSSVDSVSEGLLRNKGNNVKKYGLKQFCKQFGIDHEKRSKDIWLIEFLFYGLSDVHGMDASFLKVAESAFILQDAHESGWDEHSNCTPGELIVSHPLKRLSAKQNIILAGVLDTLYTTNKQAELKEQQIIITLTAFLQMACCILKFAPKNIKIQKIKPVSLFLQVKKRSALNNPCRPLIPLWQELFGELTLTWEFKSKNGVEVSEITSHPTMPHFGVYFRDYINAQVRKLIEIADYAIAMNGNGLDEDFIHDTRVIFRSFLSLLDSFELYLDKKWKKSALSEMKPLVKLLGKVRDMDVILLHIKEYTAANQIDEQDMAPLVEQITSKRECALSTAEKYFLSPAYRSLLEELSGDIRNIACLPIIDSKGNVIPFRLDVIMPAVVDKKALSLWAYDEWLHGLFVSEELMHRMRVAFKQLRYLLEFFSDPIGKEVEKPIKICKRCQELLGVMQDHWVVSKLALQFLESLTQEDQHGVIGAGVKEYIAYCGRETLACADRFLDYWSKKGKLGLDLQIRNL